MPYNTPTGEVTAQREWDTYTSNHRPDRGYHDVQFGRRRGCPDCHPRGRVQDLWLPEQSMASHPGPDESLGMTAVPSSNATPLGSEWFKTDQAGLGGDLPNCWLWGMCEMVNDTSSWASTIPATSKPGDYLLRNEVIALHTSNQPW